MVNKHLAKHVIMALFCVIFIVCLSVSLVVSCRQIYYFDIDYLKISQQSGISGAVCRENYDALIDYNLLGGPSELVFPDFSMSEDGRIHFEEVKSIFTFCQVAAIAGLLLFAARIWWQCRRSDLDFRWLRYTGWVTLLLVAAAGGLVAVNWDLAFVLMHKILFNNDLWIFDAATDPIIKILPDEFFLHCGIMIMVLVVIFVLGFRLLARLLDLKK